MIDMGKSLTRAVYGILLIAMAIQGLTPDYSNLASSWLLRLVTSGSADSRAADGGSAPLPTPVPRGDHDGIPGEVCAEASDRDAPRVRVGAGDRPGAPFLPVGPLDRPSRSAPRPSIPPGVVTRGSDGLIPSLCRFLC
jgi:hypothetical protein